MGVELENNPIANHSSITQHKKEFISRTLRDRGACGEHLSVLRFPFGLMVVPVLHFKKVNFC